MKILKFLDNIIIEIEKAVLSSVMLIISAAVIIQVISRYVFNHSIVGLGEVAKFGVVWITFLGTSLCTRLGTHISMTAIIEQVPKSIKKIIITVISIVSSVFSFYLGILSYELVVNTFELGHVSPSLRLPLWLIYSIAPIAFFTTAIYYFRIFLKNIKKEETYIGIDKKVDEKEDIAL